MSLKKVGVLWKKKDKNDKEFYSGVLDAGVLGHITVMVFPNSFKENEDQPDATINLVVGQKEETPF